MTLRRGASSLLVLSLVVAGSSSGAQETPAMRDAVLNRIGYGPDNWSRARIAELGIQGYIAEQLDPSSLDDSALEAEIASLYPVETMAWGASRDLYNEQVGDPNAGPFAPLRDATRARLVRTVRSKKQLEQMLVDFWFNHFNVDGTVAEGRWGFVPMERDAIRPYVFGKFKDMLRAVAQSPGMIGYLNNQVNFREGFVYLGVKRGINENYGREILELHTLGVDGGYTQEDVREVARVFTGWTIPPVEFLPPNMPPDSNGFVFFQDGHDIDPKSILGGKLVLPANRGQEDGIDLINFLAAQKPTAERIARKLVQRFVSEKPPETLVHAAKKTYLATDGDLREVMRTILTSDEFLSGQYANKKIKRPLVFVASLARIVGLENDGAFAAAMDGYLQQMGEGLYRAGPPTGYPESSHYWSGEGAYVQRMKVAYMAAHGEVGFSDRWHRKIDGTKSHRVVHQLSARFLPNGVEDSTTRKLINLADGVPAGDRIVAVAATLLASPDFLVH